MKLPFTKSTPFPATAFIPTPTRLKMGVEVQAKAAVPPVNPALNTVASDRVAALGRNPAIAPAPMPRLPQSIIGGGNTPPRLAPRMPGTAFGEPSSPLGGVSSVSPLGGMTRLPLSGRGGPMSYAPKGVGTNNPNSYAVGQNNKSFKLRTGLEGQSPASTGLPSFPGSILAGGSPSARMPQLPGSVIAAPSAPMPGRDDAFWASMDNTSFLADQEKQAAGEQTLQPPELFALEGSGGYVPMLRQADGSTKAAGGFFPGPAPDPMALPPLPLSPEQQAQSIAKQAMEQEKTFLGMGMVPALPKQATDVAGRSYAPAPDATPRPFTGKIQTEGGGEIMDKATGKMVPQPVRQFTVMEDPKTGRLVKRYVEDADGNGVPDNKEKSAPSWLDWLASQK